MYKEETTPAEQEKTYEYCIVDAVDHKSLTQKVIDLMYAGWQPLGGVAIDNSSIWRFVQAMTRNVY